MDEMTTGPLSHEEIVDWFDTVLDSSWTREDVSGWVSSETWFTLGSKHSPLARIVVDDITITIHEFGDNGVVEATTKLSGDAQRQCVRTLKILDIDD